MKFSKLTTISLLFFVSSGISGTQEEINHLLKFVSETKCQYERNGTMHSGKEAKEHIQKKYDYYEDDIKSAEEFIKLSATKSYMSGNHYMIHCPEQPVLKSSAWLLQELQVFRSTVKQ
jgi:hypothetical protein